MVRLHAQTTRARLIRLALAALLLAALAVAPACASKRLASREKDAMEELRDAADQYNRFFSWRDYDTAASFVAFEYRSAFSCAADQLADKLQIEEIQFLYAEMAPFEPKPELSEQDNTKLRLSIEGRVGHTAVRYVNYTVMPSTSVGTVRQIQYWERRGQRWVLLPDLGWVLGEQGWSECLTSAAPKPAEPPSPQGDQFVRPPAPGQTPAPPPGQP